MGDDKRDKDMTFSIDNGRLDGESYDTYCFRRKLLKKLITLRIKRGVYFYDTSVHGTYKKKKSE